MIVTRRKEIDYIKKHLKGRSRIVIVGCADCAAVCRTGGSEQIQEMAELLAENETVATMSMESPCDKRIARRDLKRLSRELERADAILALTCGSGVQALAEVSGKETVAALDTEYLGMVERLGRYHERCSLCGDCMLNETAGLCPVTLCPKGMRNGPCEGIRGTMCEVYDERECVWHRIYERLNETGRGDLFAACHEPVDWSLKHLDREQPAGSE